MATSYHDRRYLPWEITKTSKPLLVLIKSTIQTLDNLLDGNLVQKLFDYIPRSDQDSSHYKIQQARRSPMLYGYTLKCRHDFDKAQPKHPSYPKIGSNAPSSSSSSRTPAIGQQTTFFEESLGQ
jgi:hypothetical protein